MHPGRNNKGHDWHAGRQHGLRSRISDSNKTNYHHSLSFSYYNLFTNSIYESYLLNLNNFLNSRKLSSIANQIKNRKERKELIKKEKIEKKATFNITPQIPTSKFRGHSHSLKTLRTRT
ncbi:hypothetical protein EDEG_03038 [Edhazardia aedis USNM 41457]|uniref:Uncharacterized protein n=1 Tax=Edhazardia aedis (strain USNM 41457) TaxID=1003232 RepID=J8ZSE0_EDHAE|nr:hypothetical protein EDEG_03038 [Edhazardia aedis USNM 41457]|eukprot:EJW02553.1 hypothetical protein EDEG_03038 [Edhazardia aedis USNM 41457]